MRGAWLPFTVVAVGVSLLSLPGCGEKAPEAEGAKAGFDRSDYTGSTGLHGEKSAVELAESMFKHLGGQSAWKQLTSLSILALYDKNGADEPQHRQIWRDLDRLRLYVERGEGSDKRIEIIDGEHGWVDSGGEVREMDPELLRAARFDEEHDLSRTLHRLAKGEFLLRLDDEGRLLLLDKGGQLFLWMQLDAGQHPGQIGVKPGETSLEVTKWATSASMTHPRAAGPPDGSWTVHAQRWEPNPAVPQAMASRGN